MPYATVDDLRAHMGADAFIALVDVDGDGVEDTEELTAVLAALEDASSTADSYLSRFLPIATTPNWLRLGVMHIARFNLEDHPSDKLSKLYDAAMKQLRDVQSGRAGLGTDRPAQDIVDDYPIEAAEQVFGRENTAAVL